MNEELVDRMEKDTTQSCIFDFPDRPDDSLPPQSTPFYDTPLGPLPIPDFPWPPYDDYPPDDPRSTPPHTVVHPDPPGGPPSTPWPGLIFTCWVSSASIDFYWDVGGTIFDLRTMMGLPTGALLRLHPLQEGQSYWFRAMINSGYIHLFCYIISPNTLNHPSSAGDLSAPHVSLLTSSLNTDLPHTTITDKDFFHITGIVTVGHLIV